MPDAGTLTAVLPLPAGAAALTIDPGLAEAARHFFPLLEAAAGAVPADARFHLAAGAGDWRLRRDGRLVGSFGVAEHALLALEQQLEELMLRHRGDLLAVHAGAAVVADRACLVAGDAEAGKSSIGFQLAELGHPLLSEEVSLVAADGPRVLPYCRGLTLESGLIAEFGNAIEVRHGSLRRIDEGLKRYRPRRLAATAAAVGLLLLPRFRAGAAATLESLAADDVLTEFLGYCFEPPQLGDELVDRVVELLEACSIWRLVWGEAGELRRLLASELPAADTLA